MSGPKHTPEMSLSGMSLRDWFAGQVIGNLAASPERNGFSEDQDARYAYAVADAMLLAREHGVVMPKHQHRLPVDGAPVEMRPPDAAKLLGVGLSTFWRWVKEKPDFPKARKLSHRISIFRSDELLLWRDKALYAKCP